MKKIITFLLCLISLLVSNLKAQNITGDWNGVLEVMGTQLTLVFHIQESETGSMMEYAEIEQTFSPIALDEITRWLNSIIIK